MKLDLRPMLRGEISRLPVNFSLDGNNIVIDNVAITSEIQVNGSITDTAGYMRMALTVSFDYRGECARCLDEVKGAFETEFVRTVVNEGTLTEERLLDNVDEYSVITGGFLNIDDELYEAIIFDFPSKLLCSDDCLGLCPKCGKKKKLGDCGCQTKEQDPRWAKLKSFFDNN